MNPNFDDLVDFDVELDGDETEVVRIREQAFVNDQHVEPSLVKLASDDEAVDTAVVSFFDVDYVRTGDDKPAFGERARLRSESRNAPATNGFIRK